MKKTVIVIVVLVMVFANMFSVVAKTEDELIQKDVVKNKDEVKEAEVEKELTKITKELNKNSKLSKEKSKELIESMKLQLEEEYDSLMEIKVIDEAETNLLLKGSVVPSTVPAYSLGNDITISYGNESKWNEDGHDVSAILGSNNHNGIRATSLISSSQPWTWTGYRFRVMGYGYDWATISSPDIETLLSIQSYNSLSSSAGWATFKLFDLTTGTYVNTESIAFGSVNGAGGYADVISGGNYSFNAKITANHSYVVYIVTAGTLNRSGYVGSLNSWPYQGTDWSTINIDY